MDFYWIKIVILLKIVKQPIKQLSDTTMHIFSQALIVDRAPYNNTTSINSRVLKHNYELLPVCFLFLVTPEKRNNAEWHREKGQYTVSAQLLLLHPMETKIQLKPSIPV